MLHWIVMYEKGGRLYTYTKTLEEMTEYLTDRRNYGREDPYRVWAIIDGEMKKVDIG